MPVDKRKVRVDRDGHFSIDDHPYWLVSGSSIGSILYDKQWVVYDELNPDPHAVLWVENSYREARDHIDAMAVRAARAEITPRWSVGQMAYMVVGSGSGFPTQVEVIEVGRKWGKAKRFSGGTDFRFDLVTGAIENTNGFRTVRTLEQLREQR